MVAIVIDVSGSCTLQCYFIGWLRSALLRLRFRSGRFGGFAGLAGVRTADWVHHMRGRSAAGGQDFSRKRALKINLP